MMDWFQMTLYTGLIVNVTKRMNKAPIFPCTFLHQYFLIAYHTQPPLKNLVGWFFSYVDYLISNVHHSFVSFVLGLFPTKCIYRFVELLFLASYWYTLE